MLGGENDCAKRQQHVEGESDMSQGEKRRDRRKKRTVDRRRREPNRLVYTARDPVEGKRVVIKRYRNKNEALDEAKVMQAYGESPHLVRFYRFFTKRGRGHIVMERVKGRTLSKVIKKKGAMAPRKVIDIAMRILEGLKTLHDAGYVHGDLHSDNVILTNFKAGTVKIIDFQHAVRKNRDGKARARRKLPHPPVHLPPETRKRTIDDRYDIYGVGFIAACMLRGRMLRKPPRKDKHEPEANALWSVIKKAVNKRPAERYQSAAEMMKALREIAATLSDDAAAERNNTAAQPISE